MHKNVLIIILMAGIAILAFGTPLVQAQGDLPDRPDVDEGAPPRDRDSAPPDRDRDDNNDGGDNDDDDDGGDSAPPPPPPQTTPQAGSISGLVTDVCLNAPGANIQITTNTGGSTTTSESGNYAFADLAPGQYTVMIQLPDGFGVEQESATVTVISGATATVNFNFCSTGPFPQPEAVAPPELPSAGGIVPDDVLFTGWLTLHTVTPTIDDSTPVMMLPPAATCPGYGSAVVLEPGQGCVCSVVE